MDSAKNSTRVPTDDDVIDWLRRLPNLEIEIVLVKLGLRDPGEKLERLARIHDWLHGMYVAANFMELPRAKDEAEAREWREHMKQYFLKDACFIENASTRFEEYYERGMPHPLTDFLGGSEVYSSDHNRVNPSEDEYTHEETCDEGLLQIDQAGSSRTEVSVQEEYTHHLSLGSVCLQKEQMYSVYQDKVSLQEEQTHSSTDGADEQEFDSTRGQHACCAVREELLEIRAALRKLAELTEVRFSAMSAEISRLTSTVANLTSLPAQHQRHDSPVPNSRLEEANRGEASGNMLNSAHRHESTDSDILQENSHEAIPCNYLSLGSVRIVSPQLSEDPPVQVGMAWEVGESDAGASCSTAPHSDGSSKDVRPEMRYGNSSKNLVTNCEPGKGSDIRAVRAERKKRKVKSLHPEVSAKSEVACCSPKGKVGRSTSPGKGGKTGVAVSPKKQTTGVFFPSKNQSRGIGFLIRLLRQLKSISTLGRNYDRGRSNASEEGSSGKACPALSPKKTAGRKSRTRKRKRSRSFVCYGCGEPNVIRRECPRCSGCEHRGA